MANNIRIKDVEQLEEILMADLAWRKKEMLALRILVENDSTNEHILIRAGMALLCAHFEGFIKKASNCYIGYVSEQKIAYKDLINSFAVLKMSKEFVNCAKSEKNSVRSKLIRKYQNLENIKFEEKYDLDKPYISTHSNPKMDELREILCTLGIETDIFETKKNYIDSSLLANRHKVVHGEKTDLDKSDFLNTFEIIMELIEDYESVIIEAIENKNYMK